MTVCIAAMCDNGKRIVTATDGGITMGPVTGDIGMFKAKWLSFGGIDLMFLYAGRPGNADLIIEEFLSSQNGVSLRMPRKALQDAIRQAYRKRYVDWVAERVLSPWDIDLQTFKKTGRELFGKEHFEKLLKEIQFVSDSEFNEQLLVVGWGDSEHSAMIFQVDRYGSSSHAGIGWVAIGSGTEVATWTLLQLGQHRTSTLESTLYAVAAAKFSAEQSEGVGQTTVSMAVSRKRIESDQEPAIYLVPPDEVNTIRRYWEAHGRPKIPAEAMRDLLAIAKKAGGQPSLRSRILADVRAARVNKLEPPTESSE